MCCSHYSDISTHLRSAQAVSVPMLPPRETTSIIPGMVTNSKAHMLHQYSLIVRLFAGLSRVLTRPAGRVGSGRVITFKNLTGSGRVGSGRVKRFQNLAGRVGSGQEVFKISRVGSVHDPRDTGHSRVKRS